MRFLFRNLFLFCSVILLGSGALGAEIITATVAVTNAAGTTNGQTITVNGNTRTWTNSVAVPASQILTNETAGGSASNLFNQVSSNPFSGLSLNRSGTNGITLTTAPGGALAVTLSAGWGEVTLATNTLTAAVVVRVPLTVEVAASQTNVASGLVAAINSTAVTNLLNPAAPAFANLVGNSNSQSIYGIKTFEDADSVWRGQVIGAEEISGDVGALSGGYALNLYRTNGLDSSTTLWDVTWRGTNHVNDAFQLLDEGDEPWNFKSGGTTKDLDTILKVRDFNQRDFGADPSLLEGRGLIYLSRTNYALTNTVLIGTRFGGTNDFSAGADIAFGRSALTSLANGNNAAVPTGTNVFVEVSGPTGAFTINGISGGRDGKVLILLNQTGQNMTIAHDSGVDPTAGNRIYTMTAADRATTGNGAAVLIYSGAASRWILISLDP